MIHDTIRSKVLDVLKENSLGVLSTIDAEGKGPQSAVVGFAQNDDLEIIFATPNTTRKYKNLSKNQNVSFVVGWNPSQDSIQYEGVAREISTKEEIRPYIDLIVSKNPFAKGLLEREGQAIFAIKPAWIRLIQVKEKPPATHEIVF